MNLFIVDLVLFMQKEDLLMLHKCNIATHRYANATENNTITFVILHQYRLSMERFVTIERIDY